MAVMLEAATLLQVLTWGAILGCIYVLLASGLNLIFGVLKLVNFAHGEFIMIGGYASYWVSTLLGLNPYVSILASMAVVGLLGVAVERLCFRRVLGTSKLNEILLSLGLIFVLQNAAAMMWTEYPRGAHSPFALMAVQLGIMRIGVDWLVAAAVTAVIMSGFYMLLRGTKIGRAMRATSQNRSAAMLMGVNVERIHMFTFGLGTALAAAAGTLLVITTSITPYAGSVPALKAFAIIILGGLGSTAGAVVGGLLYGIVEGSAVFIFGGTWRDAVGFIILILVLIVRPTGLFGEKAVT